ncbi:peptide ABC transporter substrate-binding protein [Flexivirga meconopsidis]|uniref:peptide ABC transporter substrate-binding protein n=1 Tax=Flexivirga meconopsidis TaxID=2977121 RepID=UPI002240B562|nr:ABC transporter substrate-binding protein [Flexivirga meconopsidis]
MVLIRPRRTAAALAAATCAVTLSACGLNGQKAALGAGDTSRTLTAVTMGTIKHLTGPQDPGSQIAMTMCEGLTRLDATNGVRMAAAKSVTTTDNKTWKVVLQPNRTFDNGEPITAQTWVDSWNFTAYGPNGLVSNYAFEPLQGYDALNPENPDSKPKTDKLSGLKVVDKYTFTVTMAAPNNELPFMLSGLAFCPMPKSAFEDPAAYDKHPIGNGPYKFSSFDARKGAVVVDNPRYRGWRQPSPPSAIEFRVYNDANTAYNDVAAGNVDIMRNLPPALVSQAKRTLGPKGVTVMPANVLEQYVTWPTYLDKSYPAEVRKAFSMLIDREGIAKYLFLGSSAAARSLVPNSVTSYRPDPCGQTCDYNPAEAKRLLDKAQFRGTIPVYYASDSAANATTDASTVTAITNAAKRVGLTIEPKPTPGNQLTEMVSDHALTGPSIQLWGSSFPGSSEWIASIQVDANYGLKYQNPTVATAVKRAVAAPSRAESDRAWNTAEDQILADQVMQPLFYQREYIGHRPCARPGASGGDMIIVRTEFTCRS